MQRFRGIAALLVLSAWTVTAAPKIGKIIVRATTAQRISKGMVRSNILLREGQELDRKVLSEDIKRLYATRQFDDITADVEANGDHVDIVFTVTPKPRVAEVVFQGNRRLRDKRLRQQTKQEKDAILDEKQLAEDLRKLYDFYGDKGYHDVVIKQSVERLEETQTVNIIYDIEEGARYKTRRIRFIGNTVFSDRRLRRLMHTDVSTWGRLLPVGYFDDTEFSADLDKIHGLYLSRGYLDAAVDHVDRDFNRRGSLIYLTIHLTEGEPYTISTVDIDGNKVFDQAKLRDKIRLQPGSVYVKQTETEDVKRIRNLYNKEGYLDNIVDPRLTPDSATHKVAITYRIHEGVASTIRNVNITGNRITKDHVIRRELLVHPGDKSNATLINASRRRLMNLDYFETVEAIPVSTEDPAVKDLNIQVEEKPTGRLLLSAGFSSTENVLGAIEVSQSNFDRKNPWSFRGGGQRFRLRAQVGSSRRDYVMSFTEPWLFHRPLRLDYDLWNRSVSSNRDYNQDSTGTSVKVTRKLSRPFWRLSLGYRIEDIAINDINNDYSAAFITAEEGSELVSAVSVGLVRDHRDRLVNASNGSRLSLYSELHGEFIGSYTNQYKLTLRGEKYFPIFKRSVLKISGELGQVQKIAGDEPRVFDRLFTGGAGSIRGFKERDVGPVDPTNDNPIGGKSILLGSAELRMPIYQKTVFWTLFVDTGNVWEDSFAWAPADMNVGTGMGVRLFLPIGVISIDYGWPVVRQQDHLDTNGRLHFNLGYGF